MCAALRADCVTKIQICSLVLVREVLAGRPLAAGSVVSCTGLVQKHVTPATADLCVRLFLLSGRVQTS